MLSQKSQSQLMHRSHLCMRHGPRLSTMRHALLNSARPTRRQQHSCRCRATSAQAPQADYQALVDACEEYRRAPPSMKGDEAPNISAAMEKLASDGKLKKWGKGLEGLERRSVFMGELRRVGIKEPDQIGKPTVRNDAAFLITTVLTTSVVAVVAGQLPGDWGFFVPYLTGSICLVVLAIGSTAPGLLEAVIGKFAQVFPDYRERVLKHEAAHLLLGYLMRVPVSGYSLGLGAAHTDFAEAKIGGRLISKRLEDEDINALSVVAMAGATAEGMNFPEVQGQTADMIDLQKIMMRSQKKMQDRDQQNLTRWAVYNAASLLTAYEAEYAALQGAMQRGASVAECIQAIEAA